LNGKDCKIPLRIDLEPYRAVYRDDTFCEDQVNQRETQIKEYLTQIGKVSHLDYPKQGVLDAEPEAEEAKLSSWLAYPDLVYDKFNLPVTANSQLDDWSNTS
jgi:hypothetical protein